MQKDSVKICTALKEPGAFQIRRRHLCNFALYALLSQNLQIDSDSLPEACAIKIAAYYKKVHFILPASNNSLDYSIGLALSKQYEEDGRCWK